MHLLFQKLMNYAGILGFLIYLLINYLQSNCHISPDTDLTRSVHLKSAGRSIASVYNHKLDRIYLFAANLHQMRKLGG